MYSPAGKLPGAFRLAVLVGWIVLGTAGFLYSSEKRIAEWAALPVVAAFLLEYSFYLLPGFESVRTWLGNRFTRAQLAAFMLCSALAPYLVYSVATGAFRLTSMLSLAALAAALSYWYVFLRPGVAADVAFLALVIAAVLFKLPERIYLSPAPSVQTDVLGKLMLIRLGAIAVLIQRKMQGIGFGFIPTRREWLIGVRNFLYFLPIGLPLAWISGLIHPDPRGPVAWRAAAIFAGMLWVVALSEEFLFRGIIQQWLRRLTHSPSLAIAGAALIFGACHLPFRAFPNWKFAAIAAIAGWFYGRAYQQAASIRASMVTHALVATTWRVFFV
jgi:uncharacterized protein